MWVSLTTVWVVEGNVNSKLKSVILRKKLFTFERIRNAIGYLVCLEVDLHNWLNFFDFWISLTVWRTDLWYWYKKTTWGYGKPVGESIGISRKLSLLFFRNYRILHFWENNFYWKYRVIFFYPGVTNLFFYALLFYSPPMYTHHKVLQPHISLILNFE